MRSIDLSQGIRSQRDAKFVSPNSAADVLRRFEQYAGERGWSVTRLSDGSIEAKQGVTWKSWGQRITVSVVPTADGSAVTINTRAPYQLHDWGQGDEMLNDIRQALA